MRSLIFAIVALTSFSAFAVDLLLSPGGSAATTVTAVCTSCPPPPPPPPPEVTIAKLPGNAHAVYHPDAVAKYGYAKCQTCHALNSSTPAKVGAAGSFICSQYQFCSSGSIAGKSTCKVGITWTNLATGEQIIDPISKDPIISGGKVGGFSEGMIPQCRDCHYPHKTVKSPAKSTIHAGCLDCHRGIGNSDLKNGIEH